ncbi:MAG: HAD superfamily hydrolase (TIGR01509 family) [Pirellulaceae bacterium]|jgi:HAD superfamily hydrolase (TIGR01509 family)
MSPRAVIFDCDGTLVDSESLGNEILVEYVREFGLELPFAETLERFRGCKMADCVRELSEQLGEPLPEEFTEVYRQRAFDQFKHRLQPIDGAYELVRSVTLPKCVASSAPLKKIELSLRVTKLLSFFEGMLFSCYEIERWKPDPAVFLHAAETLKVDPKDCLVIEDSEPGVEAGVAAGMQVIAFCPHGHTEFVPEGVPIISRLDEVNQFFG